jgi:hypothetical protein
MSALERLIAHESDSKPVCKLIQEKKYFGQNPPFVPKKCFFDTAPQDSLLH